MLNKPIKGSYKSAIAAGAVYKLLGSKDLGLTNDYNTESMPKMLTSLIDGDLAWRQHDGGHTDQPNYIYFIPCGHPRNWVMKRKLKSGQHKATNKKAFGKYEVDHILRIK